MLQRKLFLKMFSMNGAAIAKKASGGVNLLSFKDIWLKYWKF